MKKAHRRILGFVFSLMSTALALPANAQLSQLKRAGDVAYDNNIPGSNPYTFIGDLIALIFSLSGIALFALLTYAGFLYLTAGGDQDKVKKAKDWIKNGIIGLVIIIAAFTISQFILGQLIDSPPQGAPVPTNTQPR